MGNTNFNTVIQMPNIVNDLVKQAVGRDAVSAIDMDYVTVAQNQKEVNHSVDFTSSADFENNNELPMGISVKIVPVQEGTGDPSSENIRPITGFTSANVIDDPDYGGFITWNQLCADVSAQTAYGITVTKNSDGSINFSGTPTAAYFALGSISTVNNHIYIYRRIAGAGVWCTYYVNWFQSTSNYDDYRIVKSNENRSGYFGLKFNNTETAVSGTASFQYFDLTQMFGASVADYIYSLEQATAGAGIEYFRNIFPKAFYEYNAGTATTAGTVNGNTVRSEEIVFPDPPETVYGGSLNVNTGVLTVTMGEIASYNGETLPGVWMSDRDVYAAGTTPSEGAQVVYELAEPVTYECDPEEIKSLIGSNHVFADTGDVSVSYTSYIPVI